MAIKITLDRVMTAVESGDYIGFCLACGAEHLDVEPDGREYPCDVCSRNKVFGAEEILFMIAA